MAGNRDFRTWRHMTEPRTPKHIRPLLAAILLVATSAISMAQGEPVAAGRIADAFPADCLIAGRVQSLGEFARHLGDLSVALGGETDREQLLAQLGRMLNNPALAGIDLTAPAHFFFMDSKKHAQPWVCQFKVTDPAALQEAVGRGELSINGETGTWGLDPVARDVVAGWRKVCAPGIAFRSAGEIVLRADVDGLMRVYDDEIAHQVDMMKGRMRTALERPQVPSDKERAITAAQAEMDTMLSIVRQVSDIELSGKISKRTVLLGADVMPKQDASLAGFIKSHPKGSLNILSRCPGDAVVVLMHNLSIRRAMERMLIRFLGMGNALSALESDDASEGQTVYAMLQSDGAANPTEILQIAMGDAAISALARWKRLSSLQPSAEGLPFRLQPVKEVPARIDGVSLAEIICNESPAHGAFGRALRWFFGDRPVAAHAVVAGQSVFIAGGAWAQLTRRIAMMADANFEPLLADRAFVQSIAAMPDHPNVLVYVSPRGVRGWLSLAGLKLDADPTESIGLCAGAALNADGRILGSVLIPIEPVEQAIRLQGRSSGPATQSADGPQ